MKRRLLYMQRSLSLLMIFCVWFSSTDAGLIEQSETIRNPWPDYYDDPPYTGEENVVKYEGYLPKTSKPVGILHLLQFGPLSSRERSDYLSVVNKRTHDEETSYGTFDEDFGDLLRERKSGGRGFEALLKAARILDNLGDSGSFNPWAG